MYLYLSSKPSAIYPENTASNFTVQLPRTISGVKECGVIEVRLPNTPQKSLFVCTDLCEDSIVDNNSLQVLRRVALKTVIPNVVTYVPLRVQSFDRICVYILKDSGQIATLTGETTITLHLQ